MSDQEKPILYALAEIIDQRKGMAPNESYVASLLAKAPEKIHEKILEEAAEVVEASGRADAHDIIHEIADLVFHTWVLMGHHEISPQQIEGELQRRFGVSGHAEKAARGKKST